MAYYDALIAAWNGATQPPAGVTGSGLLAGDTTAQKLAKLNAWTVTSPAKALLTPSAILNAIVPADLAALTSTQIALMQLLLQGTLVDASAGTAVRSQFLLIFTGKTTTISQLSALVAPYDNNQVPWYQANGYGTQPLTLATITAAGLS